MIKTELLQIYGAVEKKLRKGEFLFQEGDKAVFFYQILSGSIKMNNYNENGQEAIQGIFKADQSFGEPAIFGDFPYPANAEAVQHTTLICLESNSFLDLLKDHPPISLQLLSTLSKRLRFKAILSKAAKNEEAEHRILSLLNYSKQSAAIDGDYLIDMTRQTIANLTGLRVETVIRTLKKLEENKKVKIKNRKLYL